MRILPILAFVLVACGEEVRESADAGSSSDLGGGSDLGAPDAPDAGHCGPSSTGVLGVVDTTEGALEGASVGGEVWAFRGVPFAAPPTGPLRWAAPQPPECRESLLSADRVGPACPQTNAQGEPTGDEDCLQLNIWTSRDALEEGPPRPVLFFIHGGGNAQGSTGVGVGSDLLYDGQPLVAAQDVVVVSTNYRLGVLGYMVHPELASLAASGNYGIQDQVRALEWVRDNIRNFGGDPNRVMIFGESAGARNVCTLVASPSARGLFSAALMQSGGCTSRSRAEVLATSTTQVQASGCSGAEGGEIPCLRAKTATQLIRDNPLSVVVGAPNANPGPYVDESVIPEQPYLALRAGRHNAVPIVIGANADETSRSVPEFPTREAYQSFVRLNFGGVAEEILSLYPVSAFSSPTGAWTALTTDAQFVCPSRANARDAALGQTLPVYRYFWTQGLDASPRLAPFGAYHAVELFFVWDRLNLGGYRPTSSESGLAATVGGYWSSLAARGDPNREGQPSWPRYDPATDPTLVLDADGITVERGIRGARCDFWNRLAGR